MQFLVLSVFLLAGAASCQDWTQSEAATGQFSVLRDWVRANGGFVHDDLEYTQDNELGGGLAVKTRVERNSVLIAIPAALMLTTDKVLQERPEWSDAVQTLKLHDNVVMGLFLAIRRFAHHQPLASRTASSFDLYVKAIPTNCVNGATITVDMALAAGVRGELLQRITNYRRELERVYALLEQRFDQLAISLTLDQFAWGVCSSQTRSFNTKHAGAMAPLVDLVNHSPHSRNSRFGWADRSDVERNPQLQQGQFWILQTVSQRDICVDGKQCDVWASYKHHASNWCADNLVCCHCVCRFFGSRFGFVLNDNPTEELVFDLLAARSLFISQQQAAVTNRTEHCKQLADRVLTAVARRIRSHSFLLPHQIRFNDSLSTMQISIDGITSQQLALLRLPMWPCESLSSFVISQIVRSDIDHPPSMPLMHYLRELSAG